MDLPPIDVDLSAINLNLNNILDFQHIKRKTHQLMLILNKTPSSPLEKLIFSQDDTTREDVTKQLISDVKELYDQLLQEVNKQEEEVTEMWKNLQEMWTDISQKKEFDLRYTVARTGIHTQLKNLTRELDLAKQERQEDIADFVARIRAEIAEVWKQCMISDEEKERFTAFTSTDFNEELLDVHQQELAKWKTFHSKNQALFTKLEKRKDLWRRMKELQALLDDPNKYINRGATLLNNQRDYNVITVKIPQLEATLKKLAVAFEKENGRKLLIRGQEVHKIFEADWIDFKSQKTRRQTTRPPMSVNATPSTRTAEKRLATSRTNLTSSKRAKPGQQNHNHDGEQENHLL